MDQQIDVANHIANVAGRVTYSGAGITLVLGFLNANAAAIGIFIGIAGLIVQWYYRRKEFRLKEKEYELKGIRDDE